MICGGSLKASVAQGEGDGVPKGGASSTKPRRVRIVAIGAAVDRNHRVSGSDELEPLRFVEAGRGDMQFVMGSSGNKPLEEVQRVVVFRDGLRDL